MTQPIRFTSRQWGLLCVCVTALAMLLVWPVAESGLVDDWSVVRTAQRLSETGHIHFNGWEAPMLGWLLYPAAGAFRLFGFSFTAARLTVMGVTLCTVYLAQRIFARAGISPRNAALGALTLALSPAFFQGGVLFITDIPGLFAVLVCLYCCLRAAQAPEATAPLWVASGALLNALLGTARQIAWLALLVMVPSTIVLLWGNRRVRLIGTGAWIVGVGFLLLMLRWLNRQPFVLPEHLIYHFPHPPLLHVLFRTVFRLTLDLTLLVLPVPLAFLSKVRPSRKALIAVTGTSLVLILGCVMMFVSHARFRLAPFLLFPVPQTAENTFLSYPMPILGTSPSVLPQALRLLWTAAIVVGLLALAAASVEPKRRTSGVLADRSLLLLTVPFVVAYVALLIPRALYIFTLDRYLVYLPPFALLLLLSLFQRIGNPRLGSLAWITLGLLGFYTVTTTHDLFAVYRANLQAIAEIRHTGVPRDQISGGTEFNAYTQMTEGGVVHAGGIRLPNGSIFQGRRGAPHTACWQPSLELFPMVHPRFAVAYPGSPCTPAPGFAPVTFTTWLPPFHRTALVVTYGSPR